MSSTLTSIRLVLRPWTLDDVDAAFAIYGQRDVARWLSPAMDTVTDRDAMRLLLQQWIAEDHRAAPPTGRWAVELAAERRVIGGVVLLYLPPGGEDLEIGWQLAPGAWGHGYASEAGHTTAHWALQQPGVDELFAVVRPANTRAAATAERIGMEWVGETDKYYDLRLQVYRLRAGDLDQPLPGQSYGADQHR
jgi:RimJ/RimL family protein N-acetyltransferase